MGDIHHPTVNNTPRGRHKPQEEFENGDVLVTLLPVNERFPWVTPAAFRPELVPEELMAPSLSVNIFFTQIEVILSSPALHFLADS